MKILRYDAGSGPRFGVLGDGGEVRSLEGSPFGEHGVGAAVGDVNDLDLLPPIEPTKVIGVGLNYVSHIEEMNLTQPSFPMLFMKPLAAVIGPGEPIVYPTQGQQVEYEAELAVVIGKQARRVSEDDALDYVLGYTCGNDVSERVIQRAEMAMGALLVGKGFDTFNPLGPVVATGLDPTDLGRDGPRQWRGAAEREHLRPALRRGRAGLLHQPGPRAQPWRRDHVRHARWGRPHRPGRRGGDRGRGRGRPPQSRRSGGVAAMLRSLLNILNPGPVSARVEFEDRPYGLGGSMKLSVELKARREIDVEEARVDLECEEQWADTYVKMEPLGRTGGMLGRGKPMPGPAAPKRQVEVHTNTFVHSSVTFARGIRLAPGTPARYDFALDIGEERPPHASGGMLKWRLITTVNPDVGEPIVADSTKVRVEVP